MEKDLCFQQGPLIADIAVHVFSFLSVTERQNVAKVCRYWRSTVYQARLWKNVTVLLPLTSSDTLIRSLKARKITRYAFLRSTEEDFSRLFTSVTNVTHLNIKGCPLVSEECLKETLKSLTNLECLSFSRCRQVTDDVLIHYADVGSLDKLKSLSLEDCGNVTQVGFKALIKKLKNLDALHLTWCQKLNDSCLKTLVESCPKLSCLRLASCDWVTYNGMQYITQLKHLKGLDLHYSHSIDDDSVRLVASELDLQALDLYGIPSITMETIAFAARKLNGLKKLTFEGEELFVSHCEQLREMFNEISKLTELEYFMSELFSLEYDKDIELCYVSLLKKLPNMNLLDLGTTASKVIGEETASTIANCMPELEFLTLNSYMIKDNSITTLCTSLKKLQVLELYSCSLSDDGIRAIATSFLHLKCLTLAELPEITDVGVGYIAKNLSSLNSLDLMSCEVTDAGVALIAEGLPHLVSLNLSYCKRVSNEGALTMGKHCKQLQHLILDLTNISDLGFVFICKQLQNLRTLGAGSCPLTDKGLSDGAMFLNNLEELDVGSESITDAGLCDAVKHLGGVTEVTLTHCKLVTPVGVKYIVTELPNLNHLGIEHCSISMASIRHLEKSTKATISIYD